MLTGKSPLGEGEAVEILRKIEAGIRRVDIPNELSKEAKAFLRGCFVKNTSLRLTSEMLLNHPFLEGLDDDEDDSDDDSVESYAVISGSGDEFSCDQSWSNSDDEVVSEEGEEKAKASQVTAAKVGTSFCRAQNYPVSSAIPAAVLLQ